MRFIHGGNDSGRQGVFVIGCTNAPWLLDSALLRTGRMDLHYYIGLPDEEARLAMLTLHLEDRPVDIDIDLPLIARLSEGMNASDLEAMVNKAALYAAIRELDITQTKLEELAKEERRSVYTDKEDEQLVPESKPQHQPILGFASFQEKVRSAS